MKPRILLVSPLPPPASCGMATYTLEILNSRLRDKYEFVVLNTAKPVYVGAMLPLNLLNSAKNFLKLVYLLSSRRFDVVLIATSSYWGFYEKSLMLFLSRFLGKNVILSLRGGGFLDFYRNSGLKWWIKVALDNASAIIVLSEYWEKELQEMTENKNVHVIGIHTYAAGDRTPRRVDGGKIRVIFVGRLEKNKGIYDLIEAIKILNESDGGKKLEFMIVGGDIDGVTRKYHADNVSFLGEVNHGEVMKLYASSHILVLPTYFEGCSYVIVEAMSFGLPVISTNIPSI